MAKLLPSPQYVCVLPCNRHLSAFFRAYRPVASAPSCSHDCRARSSQSAALEIGRCLHTMVAAVEAHEQEEQREVMQVGVRADFGMDMDSVDGHGHAPCGPPQFV